MKSLSLEYKDRLVIGECRHSEKDVVKAIGVKSFPSLIVFPVGKDADPILYDGQMKSADLKKFLDAHAISKSSDKTSSNKKTKEEKPKPVPPCK